MILELAGEALGALTVITVAGLHYGTAIYKRSFDFLEEPPEKPVFHEKDGNAAATWPVRVSELPTPPINVPAVRYARSCLCAERDEICNGLNKGHFHDVAKARKRLDEVVTALSKLPPIP